MISLHNPDALMWYIILDAESNIQTYGTLNPGEQLDSIPGVKWNTYTDKSVYIKDLAAAGILISDPDGSDIPVDIEQARIIIRSKVNVVREEKLALPVTFMGNPYDSDSRSMMNIIGVLAAVSAGLPLPPGFSWRSADNVQIPMTPSMLLGLAGTMFKYIDDCYRVSWTIKAEVDASGDPRSVDINSGWPDNTNP